MITEILTYLNPGSRKLLSADATRYNSELLHNASQVTNNARAQHGYTVHDAEATTGPGGMLCQVIFYYF